MRNHSGIMVKYSNNTLLFVGNIPYEYNRGDLIRLCKHHGEIIRCLVVYGFDTGISKGYGFVEYARIQEADKAKQMMATMLLGERHLRVDFADNAMITCADLQSRTLFVDHLPKGFCDDNNLRALFKKFGVVNFCQVNKYMHCSSVKSCILWHNIIVQFLPAIAPLPEGTWQ